jgi:AcrR family transcriptional regulator
MASTVRSRGETARSRGETARSRGETAYSATVPVARSRRSDANRNRDALIRAARRIFERDGFVGARVTDIATEAGLAHGSFYSHFPGKEEALAAVLAEVEDEMLHPGPAVPAPVSDPAAVIAAANLAYLEAYRRNAKLMATLEQVATVDERFLEIRLQRSAAFVTRNARAIRRLQRAGQADPDLDPDLASLALSSMTSRTAYVAFAVGREPTDIGRLAATLTRLWVSALRIPETE